MTQDHRSQGRMENGVKRVYALFLRAYPDPFRQTFAAEMEEVFADQATEAARRGTGPLFCLAAREIWQTTAAICRAHWRNRSRYAAFLWGQVAQFFNNLYDPPTPGSPDGRTSWPQAAREVSLLAILGTGQVLTTYLLDPAGQPILRPLAALTLSLSLLWLLVGLARGMPRWAYPALGILLGNGFSASPATGTGLLLGVFLLIALVLLVWAYRVDRQKPFLPSVFRAWRQSLAADITRLSFGAYGLLALAVIVAFDDAYANNHTAWLLVSILMMLGGATAYSRSRKPAAQLGSLATGATFSFLAALLDHARFAPLQGPGLAWIFWLWCSVLVLILLPPAALRILRFFHALAQLAQRAPGG